LMLAMIGLLLSCPRDLGAGGSTETEPYVRHAIVLWCSPNVYSKLREPKRERSVL
jgi:hypothetical protein